MSQTRDLLVKKLNLTNGTTYEIEGELFAETSWYDDENASITRQKLYSTKNGSHVYSISHGNGEESVHKAYQLAKIGSTISMSDGKSEIDMPQESLMFFIKFLLDKADAEENSESTIEQIEELLKAANI